MPTCQHTQQSFELAPLEKQILADMKLDTPKYAPMVRRQNRLAFRNETHLSSRTCSGTGESIISVYDQDTAFPVYKNQYWWGDTWDGVSFGQDYDDEEDFFQQFAALQTKVPRPAIVSYQSENSDYTNCVSCNKDCYLIFSSDFNRDCLYSRWLQHCSDCMDSYYLYRSELCYNCVYSQNLYHCLWAHYASTCNDCLFVYDCRNCQDCFMSHGLRNQKYVFRNKQLSKEQYEQKMNEILPFDRSKLTSLTEEFNKMIASARKPFTFFGRADSDIEKSNFITDGEQLYNCRITHTNQKMSHCSNLVESKICCDIDYGGKCELNYNCLEAFPYPYYSVASGFCYGGDHVEYSQHCMNCSEVFGCIGLRRKKFCILNKQYSEEQYFELKHKIINAMRAEGEYGQFFPIWLSTFAYNQTNAQDEYPLTVDQAKGAGIPWKDDVVLTQKHAVVSGDVSGVSNDVVGNVFGCVMTNKPFKIGANEVRLLKKFKLPLPNSHPLVRIQKRNEYLR